MKPFAIVVKKGRRHELNVRLFKLLTRTETLLHDGAGQHVTQTCADHRRAAPSRRRSKENVEDQVRLPVKGDQQLAFKFIRSNKRHSCLLSRTSGLIVSKEFAIYRDNFAHSARANL